MKSNSVAPDLVRMSRFEIGEGGLAPLDQLGDDRGVRFDRRRDAARWRDTRLLLTERRYEVAASEDRLQGVPDKRIGLRQGLQDACATGWRLSVRGPDEGDGSAEGDLVIRR